MLQLLLMPNDDEVIAMHYSADAPLRVVLVARRHSANGAAQRLHRLPVPRLPISAASLSRCTLPLPTCHTSAARQPSGLLVKVVRARPTPRRHRSARGSHRCASSDDSASSLLFGYNTGETPTLASRRTTRGRCRFRSPFLGHESLPMGAVRLLPAHPTFAGYLVTLASCHLG